jgi:hypothetical protein
VFANLSVSGFGSRVRISGFSFGFSFLGSGFGFVFESAAVRSWPLSYVFANLLDFGFQVSGFRFRVSGFGFGSCEDRFRDGPASGAQDLQG